MAIHPGWVRFDLERAHEKARAVSGLKQEAIAALMDESPKQLRGQIVGEQHYSLHRLAKAAEDADGLKYAQSVILDFAEFLGLESRDSVAHRCREVFMSAIDQIQVRMAKASIAEREDEQRKVG